MKRTAVWKWISTYRWWQLQSQGFPKWAPVWPRAPFPLSSGAVYRTASINEEESGLVFLKVITNVAFAGCVFRPFRDTQCFCTTVGGTNLCQSSSYTGNNKVPEQWMQIMSQRQVRAYLFTFEVIWSLSSAAAVVLLSKLQATVAVF